MSCVTDPTLSSCVKAAITVAAVVATGGEAEVEIAAVDAAADAGTDVAENVAVDSAEEGAGEAEDAGSCAVGGQSFTANTKVLLASGATVPISQLKPGEKVLATNTKTGKTQPEAVTAVLVHHDTNLYDLKVRAAGKTAVIDTTKNHLFWNPSTGDRAGRWVKAGALRYGTHLRTPSGGDAVVLEGWTPKVTTGWMWDLTVPGNNDHDFYVQAATTQILVHNECGEGRVNPNSVRFSQDSISSNFKNGNSVSDTAAELRNGDVSADDFPPVRLVERDGNLYTLDNRRLAAFQQAGLPDVPYEMATSEEAAAEDWKFTTETNGLSIEIRGGGGTWTVPGT